MFFRSRRGAAPSAWPARRFRGSGRRSGCERRHSAARPTGQALRQRFPRQRGRAWPPWPRPERKAAWADERGHGCGHGRDPPHSREYGYGPGHENGCALLSSLFYELAFAAASQSLKLLLETLTTHGSEFVDAPGRDCHYLTRDGWAG